MQETIEKSTKKHTRLSGTKLSKTVLKIIQITIEPSSFHFWANMYIKGNFHFSKVTK